MATREFSKYIEVSEEWIQFVDENVLAGKVYTDFVSIISD
jgi:hypothetical protein